MFVIINFVSELNILKMNEQYKVPDKGDPSDVLQLFPSYNLQLLCCRFWWLNNWEFRELSFPYWRIYRNTKAGASIIYNGQKYELSPDKIIMIAPNTSFASKLFDNNLPAIGYNITGGRIIEDGKQIPEDSIEHLFIHFNLGFPYDHATPGIYVFNLTDHLNLKLNLITQHLIVDYSRFSFFSVLAIHSLIADLLSEIKESNWDLISSDYRILDVLGQIEKNLRGDLTNRNLSKTAHMATNAFARLFKENLGLSPQRFVKKKRIDKACVLLHHFNYSIDEVAFESGFSDRHHFSKVFKQVTGLSPAMYRKEFRIG